MGPGSILGCTGAHASSGTTRGHATQFNICWACAGWLKGEVRVLCAIELREELQCHCGSCQICRTHDSHTLGICEHTALHTLLGKTDRSNQ